MGRSRKMPPLFEVMRETDRRVAESHEAHPPGAILPRPSEPGETSSKLRISHPAPANGKVHADEEPGDAGASKGLVLPLPAILTGVGILVAVIAVIATIAFNAGAKRERDQLLPSDSNAPPAIGRSGEQKIPEPRDQTGTSRAPKRDTSAAPAPKATGAPLPVFGDDPRVEGTNYLIVERLMFDDAMAAAQFLTDNGVPSVVVPPEGTDVIELQRQPRGIWLVMVREGFLRDEFRANGTRVSEIKNSVIRLGRRWKQDKKGTTDFASCLWDKFGK